VIRIESIGRQSDYKRQYCVSPDFLDPPSPIRHEPQRLGAGVVEHRRRERAAQDRGGIEVEAVPAQVGLAVRLRGVTVHDETAAIDPVAVGEERLAHPQHHLERLLLEWYGKINTGMHEEAQAVVVAERQVVEPGEMQPRHAAAGVRVIGLRAGAAVLEPRRHGALVGMGVEGELLVIAAQAEHRVRPRPLPRDQMVDDPAAVRPAVDIVAEKDVLRLPTAGAGLAGREQAPQLVEAAVDVADGEGERGHSESSAQIRRCRQRATTI
jgi:hypothetical protein